LIAATAMRQHGVISWAQLCGLGLTPRMIRYRVGIGRLHGLFAGVYTAGHQLLSLDGRRMAAVLACGPKAVLSGRAAAAAWGLMPGAPSRIDVLTPDRGRKGAAGIALHRARRLDPKDVTTLRGIPITTVARTLLDLAVVLNGHRLERAIHEAEVLQLLDMGAVGGCVNRSNGHRGTGRLLAAFSMPDPGDTRPGFEDLFLALWRPTKLPLPAFNAMVTTCARVYEVDVLWPDAKLVVELDGGAAHRTRRAFEGDRRRDAALAAEGYLVVRLTWRRLTEEGDAVIGELRRILALRGAGRGGALASPA
jgi:hypothetical protein